MGRLETTNSYSSRSPALAVANKYADADLRQAAVIEGNVLETRIATLEQRTDTAPTEQHVKHLVGLPGMVRLIATALVHSQAA
jgi:hypothetical protein